MTQCAALELAVLI